MKTAAGLLLFFAFTVAVSTEAPSEEWRFKVFLNDREIGYHNFTLIESDAQKTLESKARFNVKFLFINAFKYEHDNTEIWQDGCLEKISASTDSNGKQFSVAGRDNGETFLVETKEGRKRLDGCVMTFAYWNKDFLNEPRLLNPQTGKYLEIDVATLEPGLVAIGDETIPVERYRLTGEKVDIEVAYDVRSGDWVGLDSQVKGRTIRYRRLAEDLNDTGTTVASSTSTLPTVFE